MFIMNCFEYKSGISLMNSSEMINFTAKWFGFKQESMMKDLKTIFKYSVFLFFLVLLNGCIPENPPPPFTAIPSYE